MKLYPKIRWSFIISCTLLSQALLLPITLFGYSEVLKIEWLYDECA